MLISLLNSHDIQIQERRKCALQEGTQSFQDRWIFVAEKDELFLSYFR